MRPRFKHLIVGLLTTAPFSVSLSSTPVLARDVTYQVVDLGADTFATAINAAGEITGWSSGGAQGFFREPDGTTINFVVAGSCSVSPVAMNDNGSIVGSATFGGDCQNVVGFLRAKDGSLMTFSGLDGWQNILPTTISADGAIAGTFSDANGIARAFMRTPEGTFSEFMALRDVSIWSIALSSHGTIAGTYCDSGLPHTTAHLSGCGGFLQRIGRRAMPFEIPGNGSNPYTVSVNDRGWIVGWNATEDTAFFRTPNGRVETNSKTQFNGVNRAGTISGFRRHNAIVFTKKHRLTEVPMPQADDLLLRAVINDHRILAGAFCEGMGCRSDGSGSHGFVAYPQK